jgi:hypothetical protein
MEIPDPTEEIKAIRHRLGAQFDYDLDRICADIQRRQAESGLKYVTRPPRRIVPKEPIVLSGGLTAAEAEISSNVNAVNALSYDQSSSKH